MHFFVWKISHTDHWIGLISWATKGNVKHVIIIWEKLEIWKKKILEFENFTLNFYILGKKPPTKTPTKKQVKI